MQAPAGTGGSRRSDKRKTLEARAECRDAKERVAVQRQRSQNLKARDGKKLRLFELGVQKSQFYYARGHFGTYVRPRADLLLLRDLQLVGRA